MFLQDPGLVLLDEASSRLDPATERLIERATDRLLGGAGARSAIIVAHKLATVRRADRIMILEAGRIVEDGARPALAADPASRFARLLAPARGGGCHDHPAAGAWRHGARIVAGAPDHASRVYLALYLAFYTLPLAAGLAMRGVFDALSGHAAAGVNVWTFVALVAGAELGAAGGDLVHRPVRHGVPPRDRGALQGHDAGLAGRRAPARAARLARRDRQPLARRRLTR